MIVVLTNRSLSPTLSPSRSATRAKATAPRSPPQDITTWSIISSWTVLQRLRIHVCITTPVTNKCHHVQKYPYGMSVSQLCVTEMVPPDCLCNNLHHLLPPLITVLATWCFLFTLSQRNQVKLLLWASSSSESAALWHRHSRESSAM